MSLLADTTWDFSLTGMFGYRLPKECRHRRRYAGAIARATGSFDEHGIAQADSGQPGVRRAVMRC